MALDIEQIKSFQVGNKTITQSTTTVVPGINPTTGSSSLQKTIQSISQLSSKSNEITEYDRIASVNLAVQFDKERQESTTFRPTFKVSPIYNNAFTGTTEYLPFLNHLSYADAEKSVVSGIWKGFPQYYEFDLLHHFSIIRDIELHMFPQI
jgi:hypothetical protein